MKRTSRVTTEDTLEIKSRNLNKLDVRNIKYPRPKQVEVGKMVEGTKVVVSGNSNVDNSDRPKKAADKDLIFEGRSSNGRVVLMFQKELSITLTRTATGWCFCSRDS
jgi:hypothetical protein